MKKPVRILLILIAIVCFGIALYYPVSEYVMQKQSVSGMEDLAAILEAERAAAAKATKAPATEAPEEAQAELPAASDPTQQPASAEETQTAQPALNDPTQPSAGEKTAAPEAQRQDEPADTTAPETDAPSAGTTAEAAEGEPTATPSPTPSPTPTATVNRRVTTGAKIWADVEKVAFDESKILPQYQKLYSMNTDMVGWLTISEPAGRKEKINYPVMQREDEEYYLTHDFNHNENANGLLILDSDCDPYTPSYNLVISGHNRWNDTMFSNLTQYYQDKRHWDIHKLIQFDSLMEERTYIVFAAFFAVDYDVYGDGFRYNANIEYSIDASQWIKEINENKLYETGVDVEFGDEFLTLTTCNSSRKKNGRFVVVARRVREGETFE